MVRTCTLFGGHHNAQSVNNDTNVTGPPFSVRGPNQQLCDSSELWTNDALCVFATLDLKDMDEHGGDVRCLKSPKKPWSIALRLKH